MDLTNLPQPVSGSQISWEYITNACQNAASSVSKPCSKGTHIQYCKPALSEQETFDLLKKEVASNLDKGQTGLEAFSNAAQTALYNGANIGDVIDAFATKVSVLQQLTTGGSYEAPVPGGEIRCDSNPDTLNPQLDDGTVDQFGHIFAYIRYTYSVGEDFAHWANEEHDPPLEWDPKGSPAAKISLKTKEDYVAGLKGISIGKKLATGGICLEQFGDFLKKELGQNNSETDQMTKDAEKYQDELKKQKKESQELIKLENEREQNDDFPW